MCDTVPIPEFAQQLARMLRKSRFIKADSQRRLLVFLVEQRLEGFTPTEWDIATQVFGRSFDWIPGENSVVRVTLGRLKNNLNEYYLHDGAADPVLISISAYTASAEYRQTLGLITPQTPPMLDAHFVAARDAFFTSPDKSTLRCVVTGKTEDIGWHHLDGDTYNLSLGNLIPLCGRLRSCIDGLRRHRRKTGIPDLDPQRLADILAPKYFREWNVSSAYGCVALAFHMGTPPYGEEPGHLRALRICDMIHYVRHRFFEPLMHHVIRQIALPFLSRITAIAPVAALRLAIQFTALLEEAGYYDDAENALSLANHVNSNAAPFGRGSQESYTLFRRRAQLLGERAPDDARFDGLLRRAGEHSADASDRLLSLEIVRAHRWLRQDSAKSLQHAHEALAPLAGAYASSLFRNDRLVIPSGLAPADLSEVFLLSAIAACRLRPDDWKRDAEQAIAWAKTLMHLGGHVLPTEYTKFISTAVENNHARAARMLRLEPSQFRPPLRSDARADIAVILKCLARIRLLQMKSAQGR